MRLLTSPDQRGQHSFALVVVCAERHASQPRVDPTRKPEFERLQRVLAIGVGGPVIAVMEKDDIASACTTQPLDDVTARLGIPITCRP
jgi:hypothetical protein